LNDQLLAELAGSPAAVTPSGPIAYARSRGVTVPPHFSEAQAKEANFSLRPRMRRLSAKRAEELAKEGYGDILAEEKEVEQEEKERRQRLEATLSESEAKASVSLFEIAPPEDQRTPIPDLQRRLYHDSYSVREFVWPWRARFRNQHDQASFNGPDYVRNFEQTWGHVPWTNLEDVFRHGERNLLRPHECGTPIMWSEREEQFHLLCCHYIPDLYNPAERRYGLRPLRLNSDRPPVMNERLGDLIPAFRRSAMRQQREEAAWESDMNLE
jgi:hypothetical protein